ncbi:MAG: hypothetical protein ACYCZN_05695 [Candidatus Dormibacteria bacterium]
MRHLLRHPLSLVLLVLVVLFVAFFLVLPAISLIFHLLIGLAIIWVGFSLFRVYRHHQSPRNS